MFNETTLILMKYIYYVYIITVVTLHKVDISNRHMTFNYNYYIYIMTAYDVDWKINILINWTAQ